MTIGKQLKKARLDANLTQESLSKRINVSRQTISNWENERSYPDISSIILLSDIYGLSLDSLLKEDKGLKENLKIQTDITRSNKWFIFIYCGWLMIYAILAELTTWFNIPKVTDSYLNIIILALPILVLIYQSYKSNRISQLLGKSTSNKLIAKIVVGASFLILIVIAFPVIDYYFSESTSTVFLARIGICFLLVIIAVSLVHRIEKFSD